MAELIFPALSVPLAMLLAYIPHFIRVFITGRKGKYDNTNPRDVASQQRSLPEGAAAVCARLAACHQNHLEMLGPYAAGIAACLAVNVDNTSLDTLAGLYLGFRALYIAVYAAPQVAAGNLRSIVFMGCLIVVVLIWGKAAFRL